MFKIERFQLFLLWDLSGELSFPRSSSQAFVAAIKGLAADAPKLEMFFTNNIN